MTSQHKQAAPAGPLEGVRVIDLSAVLMGPYATQIFGDHGADVIKIESPEGDSTRWIGPGRHPGMGPLFLHLNRNKRSVALDLKSPEGAAAMRRLIEGADVFVHNLRPASIARLGLDYESISMINPRIIWCGVYGYGEDGPYAGRPAYDDLIQGAVGIAALQQQSGASEPRYVPLTIADRLVGLHAAHSVAMALYGRERNGRGCRIDVPMFETMASVVLSDHLYGRTFEPPSGDAGYVRLLSPGRRPYETSDGYICALVYNDGHWQRFLHAIERDDLRVDPRFADLASRTRHIDEVYGFLGQTLCVQSTAHWLELFEDIDVPAVPLNTVESLLDDPHLAAVGFFRQVEHPSEGAMRTFGAPARWVGYDVSKLAPAPRLGEHTESVLRECGFDAVALASLLVGGAAVPLLADGEVSE
ncbi:CoA transferase [Acidovorax sp. LjRoot66]|uniref:CaiB/BaiF CoA transferase family protein n=1 Tax=Acidovorax sp. LjRoot66 TaxID=3342334 RepID=UPI003ECD6CC9